MLEYLQCNFISLTSIINRKAEELKRHGFDENTCTKRDLVTLGTTVREISESYSLRFCPDRLFPVLPM